MGSIYLEDKKIMVARTGFSFTQSQYDAFLVAPIGEQANGMTVSVFSALARLGIDPWSEAARLAALPGEIATAALETVIGRASEGQWQTSDAKGVAKILISLLPIPHRGMSQPVAAAPVAVFAWRGMLKTPVVLWVVAAVLAGALVYAMLPNSVPSKDAPSFYTPSWIGAPTR
jgi:hypothetical protein